MTDVNEHSPATHGSTSIELTLTLAGLRTASAAIREEPYERLPALAGSLEMAAYRMQCLCDRLRKMEDNLHMALCIIENDAGPPTDESISEVRLRWVAEIVEESGINRDQVMFRTAED